MWYNLNLQQARVSFGGKIHSLVLYLWFLGMGSGRWNGLRAEVSVDPYVFIRASTGQTQGHRYDGRRQPVPHD